MALAIDEARAFHDEAYVVDLHADTAKLMAKVGYDLAARHERVLPKRANMLGHVDLPRLREGGVAAQFFAYWSAPFPKWGDRRSVNQQIDAMDRAIARHGDELVWARTGADIRAAKAAGKV